MIECYYGHCEHHDGAEPFCSLEKCVKASLEQILEKVGTAHNAASIHGLQDEVIASTIAALVPTLNVAQLENAIAAALSEWDI